MEITFIGTGAADWPSKMRGTEGYRRFSSVLIGNDLLIDPGPHIYEFEQDFKYENLFGNVENILLTHSHSDHLDYDKLVRLCSEKDRQIWCEEHAIPEKHDVAGMRRHPLQLFEAVHVGEYTVTALPANHGTSLKQEQALHFIIEQNGSRVFYGCDGAWLRRDTWYYMREYQFDLIVLDGTLGDDYGDYRIFEHNNLRMDELIAETVRKTGVLKPDGKIMISHLAYGAQGSQEQVEERLKESGIEVAYDGCRVFINK